MYLSQPAPPSPAGTCSAGGQGGPGTLPPRHLLGIWTWGPFNALKKKHTEPRGAFHTSPLDRERSSSPANPYPGRAGQSAVGGGTQLEWEQHLQGPPTSGTRSGCFTTPVKDMQAHSHIHLRSRQLRLAKINRPAHGGTHNHMAAHMTTVKTK